MKSFYFIYVFFILLTSCMFVKTAFAGKNEIETLIFTQLNRMFFPEQYILDIQERLIYQEDKQKIQQYLPGLPLFSNKNERNLFDSSGNILPWEQKDTDKIAYDVFVVFDKSINKERRTLAEQLIRRIFLLRAPQSLNKIEITQASILKVMPEELKESLRPLAPIAAANQANNTTDSDWGDETDSDLQDTTTAAKILATPAPTNTTTNSQDTHPVVTEKPNSENALSMRDLLLVAWGLLASIGLLVILSRKNNHQQTHQMPYLHPAPNVIPEKNMSEKEVPREGKKSNKILIKERQLLQFRDEIMELCEQDPNSVAAILSGWTGESPEGASNSRLVLQNCKVSTLMTISKALSPCEIQAVFNKKAEEFDPLSHQNIIALERLRGALALHASGDLKQEEKGSFAFLKKISPEQLADLLRDESIEVIAYVATQLSPLQLSNVLRNYSETQLSALTNALSNTAELSEEQVDILRSDLFDKLRQQHKNTKPSERSISKTVMQFLSVMTHPHKQIAIAKELHSRSPALYTRARENILLPYDLDNLSDSSSKLIATQIEAETLATALGQLNYPFDKLQSYLPPTYQAIFSDEMTTEHNDNEREKAWRQVKNAIQDLISEGIMSESDLSAAKNKSLAYERELINQQNQGVSQNEKNITVAA